MSLSACFTFSLLITPFSSQKPTKAKEKLKKIKNKKIKNFLINIRVYLPPFLSE
jgi:hypothetical protein